MTVGIVTGRLVIAASTRLPSGCSNVIVTV
jgi:hypothetical protein